MATQYRYSSVQLAQGATGNVASFGTNLPVNFSGQTLNGTTSAFSVAGWVRMRQTPAAGQTFLVFAAEGQFQIEIDSTGIPAAGFAGNAVRAQPTLPINDGAWHFIAVSYQETAPGTNTGIVSLFVDGLPVDSENVQLQGATQPGACILGKNVNFMDFAAWCIWSAPLSQHFLEVPLFGLPPKGGLADTSLVGAWDFANGPATDISDNKRPVTVAQQNWLTSALTGSADASVDLPNIPPVFQSPFTVMMWCFVPPDLAGTQTLFNYNTGQLDNGAAIIVQVTKSTATAALCFDLDQNELPSLAQLSSPMTPGVWNHLAFLYDHGAQTFTQCVNGVVTASVSLTSSQCDLIAPNVFLQIGAPTVLIQAISFWNATLVLADVQKFMINDPTEVPTCSAYYELIGDFGNSVTGNSATPATSSAIIEQVVPVTTGDEVAPLIFPASRVPNEVPILQMEDYRALADAHGIAVPADLVDADIEALFMNYSGILQQLMSKSALAQYRTEFYRSQLLARRLDQKGIRVGVLSSKIEGPERVWFYHTVDGPREIDRIPADTMDELAASTLTIIFDVIGIFAAVFGIPSSANRVLATARNLRAPIKTACERIIAAARAVSGGTPPQVFGRAAQCVVDTITAVARLRAIASLIWAIFAGSTWSLVFTIASLLLQIAAAVLSGGVVLLVRVLLIGVALAQLAHDLFAPLDEAAIPGKVLPAAQGVDYQEQHVVPGGVTYV